MQWLTFTSGMTGNTNLFEEDAFWIEKFRELYLITRPSRSSTQSSATACRVFRPGLSTRSRRLLGRDGAHAPSSSPSIAIPILTITGHYDGDQPGALAYYREHMELRHRRRPRASHYPDHRTVGPRRHAHAEKEFGGLKFGDA